MGRSTTCVWLVPLLLGSVLVVGCASQRYNGKLIGRLEPLHHDVKGNVYAVDSRTIHISDFSYDGTAPDAFFYAGTSSAPSDRGFIIPDEDGGKNPLGRYRSKDVTLTLPEGKTLKDIKWISIWCRAFAIDFGHVMLGSSLDYPRPQKVDALPSLQHGVSSDRVVVVDAQTFLIPNFSYDGEAPDGHFWVGKGTQPGPTGTVVPDENGSEEPLKRYSRKTIVITLPGDLTVFDIDYLSVWCKAFLANFGHVSIPRNLNVPPSLKMLGVAPQTKLNCEVLWDDLALEVRWAVAGESVVMQLVGRISDGEYMAFGLSGSPTRSVMTGGDVTVGWLERATGRGVAQDYYLGAKSQCQGGRGSCPDEQVTGGKNNVRLLNAALINDFTMLTYQRPLHSSLDHHNTDQPILTNATQAVIWAVGPVNSQGHTSYHTLRLRGDMFVNFGRTPEWNCPIPEDHPPAPSSPNSRPPQSSSGPSEPAAAPPAPNPWYIPPIPCDEPEDGVLYAQIGPTGGVNGYNAITGHVGWGISWYINGLLIPEINVVRGKTYTFVVEGGYDPERPARYHPFYITDDPEGGYEFKTPAQRDRTRVFAGVGQDRDGSAVPNAFGRLCEWSPNPNQPTADAFDSFGGYQRTLTLDCQEGQPGILQWTPDAETPDLVYYQCYTHRFLGWKINVHDGCNEGVITASGSNQQPTVVLPDSGPSPTSPHFFTSDGRPLPPDSLPAPPRLLVGGQRHHSSATLTNRPQTRPYQGEYPPPIPQNIPPLAQFTPQQQQQQQQQPFRRPSITLPPLPPSPSATATATASGSAPRPILLPAPPQFITPTATTTTTTTATTTITNTKGASRRHRVTPSPSSSGVKRTPPPRPHPHSAPSAGVKRTPPPRPHPSAPSTGVKRTQSPSSGVKRTPPPRPHPAPSAGVKRTQSSSSGVKRTPSTHPHSAPSSGVDKTHLTILKDVWAALTHS